MEPARRRLGELPRGARRSCPRAIPATTLTRERWLLLLFEELGYGRAADRDARSRSTASPTPSRTPGGTSPIHLVGCTSPLDRRTRGRRRRRRRSRPHGLVQELLNRSDERLWGIRPNGLQLRLLRDNVVAHPPGVRRVRPRGDVRRRGLRRLRAALAALPRSRGSRARRPHECWLERWSQEAAKQGTRALDELRDGVEAAIAALGAGFLAHPANADAARRAAARRPRQRRTTTASCCASSTGCCSCSSPRTASSCSDPDGDATRRASATRATTRPRACARWPSAAAARRTPTCGAGLQLVMRRARRRRRAAPRSACPRSAASSGREQAIPHLDGAELAERATCSTRSARSRPSSDGKVLRSVDYRNLGAEELGSVYESLLELHPELDADAGTFALTTAAGNERKTTGSYYTPTSLITVPARLGARPGARRGGREPDAEAAILDLKVCDPACGSGHFLVAAAHRIAKRLAAVRTGDDEPSPEATAARAPRRRRPLPLRRRRQPDGGRAVQGQPLAGGARARQAALASSTPTSSAATACSARRRRSSPRASPTRRSSRSRATTRRSRRRSASRTSTSARASSRSRTQTIDLVVRPRGRGRGARGSRRRDARRRSTPRSASSASSSRSEAYERAKLAADAWCAAFVQRKAKDAPRITTGVVRRIASGSGPVPHDVADEVRRLAAEYGFFHWEVEFPGVFGRRERRLRRRARQPAVGARQAAGEGVLRRHIPRSQARATPLRGRG